MRVLPIPFTGAMVLALIAGTKTETRRLDDVARYQVGDHLYVREEIQAFAEQEHLRVQYRSDGTVSDFDWPAQWKRQTARPMHMFKEFSRLTLIVEEARVERLQSIADDGAIAEGIEKIPYQGKDPHFQGDWGWRDYADHPHAAVRFHSSLPILSYASLWNRINAARGHDWASNPWVTVTRFKVIPQHVDQVAA